MMDMQTSRCSKLVDVAYDGYAVSPGATGVYFVSIYLGFTVEKSFQQKNYV